MAKECVAPRCPHGAPYATPKRKPITSMSGSMDKADHAHIVAATASVERAGRVAWARAAAMPTTTCPREAMTELGVLLARAQAPRVVEKI
jgi:hypothetical protein